MKTTSEMSYEPSGSGLPKKSPLTKFVEQTKQASRVLRTEGLDEGKSSAVPDLIDQALHPKAASKTDKPKSEAGPEKSVFKGAGEYEGADLSRSNAIKRAVARPQRAKSLLHRSNAVRGQKRAGP